jgi:hypothetical protein
MQACNDTVERMSSHGGHGTGRRWRGIAQRRISLPLIRVLTTHFWPPMLAGTVSPYRERLQKVKILLASVG